MESNINTKEHQLLLDAITDHAIFMMDTTGHIISWNEGAKRLKGFEESDVIGHHFRMLFVPEDRQGRPESEMQQALEKGRFSEEWWRMRKDGSRFWAMVILQPVYDEQNNHVGFAKITTDRSLQKRSDALNEFLMNEVSGYAIFLLDNNGHVAKWSKAAEHITGYAEPEIMGRPLSVFYLHHTTDDAGSWIDQHLAKARGNRYEDEDWKVKKDGSLFRANYSIAPLHNQDGYVVLMRDLTEKLALEQTANAKMALEISNQELGRFAQIAGHDLKEPIRKIATFSDMLKPESPEQKKIVDKIVGISKVARGLIDDILAFADVAHSTEFEHQDLNAILQEVLASMEEVIKERQAVVNYAPLPAMRIIPEQITQLFSNLISNAIKFCCTGNQTPVVQIEGIIVAKAHLPPAILKHVVPSDYYLQINVQDNGIGFDPAYANNIFELFVRLHGKGAYEGSGTGLAICKKAALSHGGYISAFSEKGAGSLFVVTLPYTQPG